MSASRAFVRLQTSQSGKSWCCNLLAHGFKSNFAALTTIVSRYNPGQPRAMLPQVSKWFCSMPIARVLFAALMLQSTGGAFAGTKKNEPVSVTLPVDAIRFVGVTVYDPAELAMEVSRFLEGRTPADRLSAIAVAVETIYHRDGFLFAEAAVVNNEDGTAAVMVDEGRIGRLSFRGLPASAVGAIAAILDPAVSNGPVRQSSFERRLAIASDLAGIQVQAGYQADANESILTVSGTLARQSGVAGVEMLPVRPGQGVRAFVSQEFYSSFVTGDLLRATGIVSREPGNSFSGAVFTAYRAPVSSNGTYVEFYGGNVVGRRTFERNDVTNRLNGITAGGLIGLLTRRSIDDFAYIVLETEYQRARSRNGNVLAQSEAVTARLHWTGGHDYARGGILRWGLTMSAGFRPSDTIAPFTDGPPKFAHLRGDFGTVRVISSDSNTTVRFDLRSQLSLTTLPEVERFAVGHAPFLRGYAPAEVEGDSGVSATLELARSYEFWLRGKHFASTMPFAFLSVAGAWLDRPRAALGEQSARSIASVGIGNEFRFDAWKLSGWAALPLASGTRTRAGDTGVYLSLTRGW